MRIGRINERPFEAEPGEVVPVAAATPAVAVAAVEPVRTPHSSTTCEGCGCKVTSRGEIIEVGERFKKMRRHDELIEEKDREIARLSRENTELRGQLAQATPGAETPRAGLRPSWL